MYNGDDCTMGGARGMNLLLLWVCNGKIDRLPSIIHGVCFPLPLVR